MSEVTGEFDTIATGHSANVKRSRDGPHQKFLGLSCCDFPLLTAQLTSIKHVLCEITIQVIDGGW